MAMPRRSRLFLNTSLLGAARAFGKPLDGIILAYHLTRKRRAAMRAVNPAFIPRNHLVEEALSAAVDNGDVSPFESLLTVLSSPYDDQPALACYADPPRLDQVVHQTFCGT